MGNEVIPKQATFALSKHTLTYENAPRGKLVGNDMEDGTEDGP